MLFKVVHFLGNISGVLKFILMQKVPYFTVNTLYTYCTQ